MAEKDGHFDAWKDKKDGTQVIAADRYLEPHADSLRYRFSKYNEIKNAIEESEGGLDKFAQSYKSFGLHAVEGGVEYREWAPGAQSVAVFGDFNGWNRNSHQLTRGEFGIWTTTIPDNEDGSPGVPHGSKVKVCIVTPGGMHLDRNPAWATYLIQNPSTLLFDTVFWNPPEEQKYQWKHQKHPPAPECMRIYECHVGMGSADPKVGTYDEFTDNILPRIKDLGFTAIQIMAIMEHAYYGSFGYHVTNFFAISSRSGDPEGLKRLIDTAHGMGLVVLMDVVHSHASSNSMDGINQFDGTDHQYFHEGERGRHSLWDSRLFNYGQWEVIRFLLSNLRWYMEEYHFDGFRFDGVTSMLYKHHGIQVQFSGDYREYFGLHVDVDACVYLMLANDLVRQLNPESGITIAEDVSGMPTVCRPVSEGGLGFDYRLGMSVPDKWIELLSKEKDEAWNMGNIAFTLTNRRWNEATIGYAESHDQALVGDKTLAFWLMDAAMYTSMGLDQQSPVVERGVALHKMIRLISYGLAGEGYLTFMGNEFGHPEWVDFPRAGNGFSYEKARRRWDLADNKGLRYSQMQLWEKLMHELETSHFFCRKSVHQYVVLAHDGDKVVAFEKGDRLLFVFNFHPTQSYTDYRIGTHWGGKYRLVLDSDGTNVGGQGRVHWHVVHQTSNSPWQSRSHSLQLYLPSRTCQVYHCFELDSEAEEAARKAAPAAAAATTAETVTEVDAVKAAPEAKAAAAPTDVAAPEVAAKADVPKKSPA
ncbi:hypothetical protein I4F81_005674 [Pyropia yezoensis]|uniref:Uncharacterized protein n=1 Tax=Pyropia yezoensis TaxID=2788 RepID=A0ACC3BZK8_PYRYE|nr:hypothetical protein I4F81_005674 [Neopyropia yezoensis]|eukprot:contig_22184_g5484